MQLLLLMIAIFVLAIGIPVIINKLLPSKGKDPDVHKGNPFGDPKSWYHDQNGRDST